MAAPSTAVPSTDALERSLRGFSIHDTSGRGCYGGGGGGEMSRGRATEKPQMNVENEHEEFTLDLNSETSLPFNWEQCLDLKTGEIFFFNKSNGVKTREGPREMPEYSGQYYYSEDAQEDEDDVGEISDYERRRSRRR